MLTADAVLAYAPETDPDRSIIDLYYGLGCSKRQIALALGISPSLVARRLRYWVDRTPWPSRGIAFALHAPSQIDRPPNPDDLSPAAARRYLARWRAARRKLPDEWVGAAIRKAGQLEAYRDVYGQLVLHAADADDAAAREALERFAELVAQMIVQADAAPP